MENMSVEKSAVWKRTSSFARFIGNLYVQKLRLKVAIVIACINGKMKLASELE